LLDRKSKITAPTNEREPPQVGIGIDPMRTHAPVCFRQKPDFLVLANGGNGATGRSRQFPYRHFFGNEHAFLLAPQVTLRDTLRQD
jgi:hypothetical protein